MSDFEGYYRQYQEEAEGVIVVRGDRPAPGRRTLTMSLPARDGKRAGAGATTAAGTDAAAGAAAGAATPPDDARSGAEPLAADPRVAWQLAASVRPDLAGDAPDAVAAFEQATSGASSEVPYRDQMERGFAADFGGVRAFLGRAAELAPLGTEAATRGDAVAFASSSPSPILVAHELTHVLQFRAAGGAAGSGGLSEPGDAAEHEADAVARAVVRGAPRPAIRATPTAAVMRGEGVLATAMTFSEWSGPLVPALVESLAEHVPWVSVEERQQAVIGFLEELWDQAPEKVRDLTPTDSKVVSGLVGCLATLLRAYIQSEGTASERIGQVGHETLPSALATLSSTVVTSYAPTIPVLASLPVTAVATAASWGVYRLARIAYPAVGTRPTGVRTLRFAGDLFQVELQSSGTLGTLGTGYYRVEARPVIAPTAHPWFQAGGKLILEMSDSETIVGIAESGGMWLHLGKPGAGGFHLGGATASWDPLFGLVFKAPPVEVPIPKHLERDYGVTDDDESFRQEPTWIRPLTITPSGWLTGELRYGSINVRFGPIYQWGAKVSRTDQPHQGGQDQERGQEDQSDREHGQDQVDPVANQVQPPIEEPQPRGGGSLAGKLHDLFSARTKGFWVGGLMRSVQLGARAHRIAIAPSPRESTTAPPTPNQSQASTGLWSKVSYGLSYLNPMSYVSITKQLENLSLPFGQDTFPKIELSRFRAAVQDLGGRLVVSMDAALAVTLANGASGGGDMVVRWTPYDEPFIAMSGNVDLGTLGNIRGIEADPVDGIGVASAHLSLPLPTFLDSTGKVRLEGDLSWLRIGNGFHFRDIEAALVNLVIPGGTVDPEAHVKIARVAVGAAAGRTGTRFRAGIEGAQLRNVFENPIIVGGHVAWGGGERVTGDVNGGVENLDVFDGELHVDRVTAGAGIDEHGQRKFHVRGTAFGLRAPGVADEQTPQLRLAKAELGVESGPAGSRIDVNVEGAELRGLLEQPIQAGGRLGWGGGKRVSARLEVGVDNLDLLDGHVRVARGQLAAGYEQGRLAGAIDTSQVLLRLGDDFELSAGRAALVIGPKGLAGTQIHDLVAAYKGSGAAVDSFVVDETGFTAKNVSVMLDTRTLASFAYKIFDKEDMPDWLTDTNLRVRVGFDLTHVKGQKATMSRPRFSIRSAGLSLFGTGGGFDLDRGKAWLQVSKSGGFAPVAQIPLYAGVGLEVGGFLDYKVGARAEASIRKVPDGVDVADEPGAILFDAGLDLLATLSGGVMAGAFGGMPGVFTISGGLRGGLRVNTNLRSHVEGALHLPRKGKKASGSLGLSFTFRNKEGTGPAEIRVLAGPYIAVEFLGMTRKTLKLNLLDAPLAQLEAYGALLIDSSAGKADPLGEYIKTIPEVGFPAYKLTVHPDLLNAVQTGKNAIFKKRIEHAQKTMQASFANFDAVGTRIQEEERARTGAKRPDHGPEQTKARQAFTELEQQVELGKRTEKKGEDAIDDLEDRRKVLEAKRRRYQWQLLCLEQGELEAEADVDDEDDEPEADIDENQSASGGQDQEATGNSAEGGSVQPTAPSKKPSRWQRTRRFVLQAPRDSLALLKQGKVGASLATFRSDSAGRLPSEVEVPASRLELDHEGRGDRVEKLSRSQIETKVRHKDEELALLEKQREEIQHELDTGAEAQAGREIELEDARYKKLRAERLVKLGNVPLQEGLDQRREQRRELDHRQFDKRRDQIEEDKTRVKEGQGFEKVKGAFGVLGHSIQLGANKLDRNVRKAEQSTIAKLTPQTLEEWQEQYAEDVVESWDKSNRLYRQGGHEKIHQEMRVKRIEVELESVRERIRQLGEQIKQRKPPALPPKPQAEGQGPVATPPLPTTARGLVDHQLGVQSTTMWPAQPDQQVNPSGQGVSALQPQGLQADRPVDRPVDPPQLPQVGVDQQVGVGQQPVVGQQPAVWSWDTPNDPSKEPLAPMFAPGPVFNLEYELAFWMRRETELVNDLSQVETRYEKSVEVKDPLDGLSPEHQRLLREAATISPASVEKVEKHNDADIRKRLGSARRAQRELAKQVELLETLNLAIDKLREHLESLGQVDETATDPLAQARETERIRTAKELKRLERKVQLVELKRKKAALLVEEADAKVKVTAANLVDVEMVLRRRAFEVFGTLEDRLETPGEVPDVVVAVNVTDPDSTWIIHPTGQHGQRVYEGKATRPVATLTIADADLGDLADGLTTLEALLSRQKNPVRVSGEVQAVKAVFAHFHG